MYTYEHTCAAPVTHIHAHLSFCVGPQLLALEMDNTLLGIAVQSFNTLTEFCQGPCHENQETLVACNVCHEVCKPASASPARTSRTPQDCVPIIGCHPP